MRCPLHSALVWHHDWHLPMQILKLLHLPLSKSFGHTLIPIGVSAPPRGWSLLVAFITPLELWLPELCCPSMGHPNTIIKLLHHTSADPLVGGCLLNSTQAPVPPTHIGPAVQGNAACGDASGICLSSQSGSLALPLKHEFFIFLSTS